MFSFSLSKKSIIKGVFLTPIILALFSEILLFVKPSLGSPVKLFSLGLMLIIVLLSGKTNKYLIIISSILIPIFIYAFVISYSYFAAFESLLRFWFPIVVLFYSYCLRNKMKLLLSFFIALLVLNAIVQIFNYIFWIKGYNLWFFQLHPNGIYTPPTVNGVLRATGLFGFFSLYGYFNLVMFFIIHEYYNGRKKRLLLFICILGIILSISYKAIISFVVVVFLFSRQRVKIILSGLSSLLLFLFLFPDKAQSFIDAAILRANYYIFEGNSARFESYIVMFENTSFLGEGLGTFGGPASVKYNSPFYDKVDFNWYGLKLATTDTYFPHLFIELGLLGSFVYFVCLFTPFYFKTFNYRVLNVLIIIYFTLIFDSIFSFSLNNLSYLLISLLWCFPLIYSNKKDLQYGS